MSFSTVVSCSRERGGGGGGKKGTKVVNWWVSFGLKLPIHQWVCVTHQRGTHKESLFCHIMVSNFILFNYGENHFKIPFTDESEWDEKGEKVVTVNRCV
jgi:hypothetical protein